jgi:NAD(P)-dependent dehydrogenase (short-subunit alcohol dehydrogenase family)
MNTVERLAQRYPQKRVLISGATSGLGEALALRFAQAGFRVGVAGRNPEKVGATAKKVEAYGGTALPVQLEVTRVEEFGRAVALIEAEWGGLDILINNAGIPAASRVADTSPEIWHHVLDTNLWSVIHGCRLFLPMMQRGNGGHIVNVSSTAGLICGPGMSTYNVSKAGVIALSETMAAELAEDRVDVTVCCPTLFKSGIFDNVDAHAENELFYGTAAAGLQSQMPAVGVTSDDVATRLIGAMARRRLYSLPMRDARIAWRIFRFIPETFRKILLQMYQRQLWVFKS